MRFVDRYKFAIFNKTIHYNEDIVIVSITNKVLRFK